MKARAVVRTTAGTEVASDWEEMSEEQLANVRRLFTDLLGGAGTGYLAVVEGLNEVFVPLSQVELVRVEQETGSNG